MKNLLSTNSVSALQKESNNTMSLFEKTIARITRNSEKVEAARQSRLDKVASLQEKMDAHTVEINQLNELSSVNNTRVERLVAFLEE